VIVVAAPLFTTLIILFAFSAIRASSGICFNPHILTQRYRYRFGRDTARRMKKQGDRTPSFIPQRSDQSQRSPWDDRVKFSHSKRIGLLRRKLRAFLTGEAQKAPLNSGCFNTSKR
jgi:hypothetical protein